MQEIDLTVCSQSNPVYERFLVDLQARATALMTDAEFVYGVVVGLEAYEAEVDETGHPLTHREMLPTVQEELNPRVIAREAAIARARGDDFNSPAYLTGFLAGWIYAYHVGPLPEPDPEPESEPGTKPLGVVIPFPLQSREKLTR